MDTEKQEDREEKHEEEEKEQEDGKEEEEEERVAKSASQGAEYQHTLWQEGRRTLLIYYPITVYLMGENYFKFLKFVGYYEKFLHNDFQNQSVPPIYIQHIYHGYVSLMLVPCNLRVQDEKFLTSCF